jgi:TusE/DsrC/DsvC family sulfur relay protein
MGVSPTSESNIVSDEDGFMQEPDKWNRDIAKILAERQGVGALSEVHWMVINYLRDYYLEWRIPPPVAKLRKETGLNLKRICTLFPAGLSMGPVR